ncbi:MAG: hypothetical protein AAF610_14800 [Pseudomonadota bacterium]
MRETTDAGDVIAVQNLQEFFRDAVDTAIIDQNLDVTPHTAHYVVNLLTLFSRSDDFYERTDDGVAIKPLATMLSDALDCTNDAQRAERYRRLGDVALFVAGFFAQSFQRRAVNIDYYIAMGGNAYGAVSHTLRGTSQQRVFGGVFRELSSKFQPIVDVLNDVAHKPGDRHLVHAYEMFQRTGSPRAARTLRQNGVVPLGPTRRGRWRIR